MMSYERPICGLGISNSNFKGEKKHQLKFFRPIFLLFSLVNTKKTNNFA